MAISRPYHRTYRPTKSGHLSNPGDYLLDPEYARNGEHYVRAYSMIQKDLVSIFEYVEPAEECRNAYSYRIHALLLRTCVEIEANFKAIFAENGYKSGRNKFTISDYRKVDVSHRLSSYEVVLPIWHGQSKTLKPFENWKIKPSAGDSDETNRPSLPWYKAYNESKHDRHEKFTLANFENLVTAVAGLFVLVSAQFKQEDFSAGPNHLIFTTDKTGPQHGIGSLFRIKFPDDWDDAELYEFDWELIRTDANRFQNFDYASVSTLKQA